MKKTVLLSALCLVLLAIVAAAPAAAAALSSADPCPASCSCLLPAEAAKAGSPGACGGNLRACAADAQGVRKFCYEKTSLKPPSVIATMVFMATTTAAPQACAAGCSCLGPEDGKAKGLPFCSGEQTLCAGSPDRDPKYCFAAAATVAARTTTPAQVTIAPIKPRASLVAVPVASAPGTPVLPPVSARVLATTPVPGTTTGAVPAEGGFFSGIADFVGSLLGLPSASTVSRMVSCNGILTDLMADPANCGECGRVCPDGPCVMGTCRDRSGQASRPCNRTETLCNGACTDIMFNENACGNCTHACGFNEGCCSGYCVNLSEREHCGSCGNVCRGFFTDCVRGECICYGDTSRCPDGYCYTLTSDERHCGSCDTTCREGETCCSGSCVNLSGNDPGNCGTCGRECQGTEICVNGECRNTGYSEGNCGGRGIQCPAGETCCEGACVDLNSLAACGSTCFNKVTCGAGQVCCSGECEFEQDNCGTCGTRCDFNERCCNGICTLVTSTDRCGSCTNRCDWNEVCHHRARSDYDCISWWDSLWD